MLLVTLLFDGVLAYLATVVGVVDSISGLISDMGIIYVVVLAGVSGIALGVRALCRRSAGFEKATPFLLGSLVASSLILIPPIGQICDKMRENKMQAAIIQSGPKANLNWSTLSVSGVSYADRKLDDSHIEHAHLVAVDFSGSDLSESSFRDSTLDDVDFAEANMCGVDLRGANLAGAVGLDRIKVWSYVLYDSHTIWPKGFFIDGTQGPIRYHGFDRVYECNPGVIKRFEE